MAFRLCPNNNPTKAPPAECFSQHPLKLANGETFYFLEPQLKMPGAEERVELTAEQAAALTATRKDNIEKYWKNDDSHEKKGGKIKNP